MRIVPALLAVLALAAPLAAEAQAADAGDRAATAYDEIERGAWVGSNIGAVFYFSTPGEGGAFSNGALLGIEAGYDLADRLQAGISVAGQSIGADVNYRGITDTTADPKRARGDFHSLLAGATLRYAFVTAADENEVERTHVYLKVGAGAALSRPVGIVESSGFYVMGGPGVEYFTRLRHFSVGLEVDGLALMAGGTAVGMAVLPHLKYSF